jgi:predicted RNase H-like nuclease (RuvC/YqgF family)
MDSDGDGNGRWMTYGEIAASRGTSRIAAVRLTQRHKWRRQKGNDGFARVLVPPDMLRPERRNPDDEDSNIDGNSDGDRSVLAGALAALEGALIEANKRADAAQVLAERTLAELTDANARADRERERADDDRRQAQARADAIEAERRGAETRTAEVLTLADGLRAMLEESRLEVDELRASVERSNAEAEQAAQPKQQVDAERRRADAAQQRADRAEDRADELRRHIDELEINLNAARAEAQQVAETTTMLTRDEVARKARGRLRRAWAAWRGE